MGTLMSVLIFSIIVSSLYVRETMLSGGTITIHADPSYTLVEKAMT